MITARDREEIKRIVLDTSIRISQLKETNSVNSSDFIDIIQEDEDAYQSRRVSIENFLKSTREKYPSFDGAKYKGIAKPDDEVFVPDLTTDTFWFAFEPGEYPAYGGLVVNETPKVFIHKIDFSSWEDETLWSEPNGTIPFLLHKSSFGETEVITDKIAATQGYKYCVNTNIVSTGTYDTFRIDEYYFDGSKLRSYEKKGSYFEIIPGERTYYLTITVVQNQANPIDLSSSVIYITASIYSLVSDNYKYLATLGSQVLPETWSWDNIINTPTTLEGYGIRNGVSITQLSAALQNYLDKQTASLTYQPIGEYLTAGDIKKITISKGSIKEKEFYPGLTPTTINIPDKLSYLLNDVNFITLNDIPEWARAANKPSYSFSEISGVAADSQLPITLATESDITQILNILD